MVPTPVPPIPAPNPPPPPTPSLDSILVLDLDVHQGNGTADLFQGEPRVTTFDMFGEGGRGTGGGATCASERVRLSVCMRVRV